MSLINKIWHESPNEVFKTLKKKIVRITSKPEWIEVKSGPLKGGQLFLAADLFEGLNEMITGRYDSFIYDEIKRSCNIVGAVCWDIGAHFGYHSLSFASLAGENGHVYAFEPNPFNIARFKMHLEKNKTQAKRITLNTSAISDVDGEMTFVFSNDVDGSRSSGSHLQSAQAPLEAEVYKNKKFKTQTVNTLTIDSFINTPEARIPDIIKIDVEGAELLVLKGGKEFFKNHKPIIFMEVHNILTMFYVHKLLIEHGYSVQVLDENNSTLSRCFIKAQPV